MVSPPYPAARDLPISVDPPSTVSVPFQPGQVSLSQMSSIFVPTSTTDPSQPSSTLPDPLSSTGTDFGPSSLSSSSTSGISTSITPTPPFAPVPSHTTSSSIPNNPSHSSSPSTSNSTTNTGAIAGGVVGAVAGIALIAALIFLWLRRRSSRTVRGAGGYPPSPRMKSSPWILPAIRSAYPRPRKERLASLEEAADLASHASNESYPSQLSPAQGTGSSGSRPASGLPPHFAFRNLSSSSVPRILTAGIRESFPTTVSPVVSSASYDADAYNSGIADSPNIRQSFPVDVDPFGSHSSIASVAAVNPVDGMRRTGSTNRVTRKPVPTFEGDIETVGGSESAVGSNRPTTDLTRSGSRSSAAEKDASNVSLNAHDVPGFKFAGGKEGPVHYLIPDLPPTA